MSEVIVVGAGPTGLTIAGDLAAAGVSCTVLERRTGESNLTRAFAVHARTLEILDARGLADPLIATGQKVSTLRVLGQVTVDLSGLPSRFPFVLITPQYQTEKLLAGRAADNGAEFVTGADVTRLRQDDTGVDVDIRHADGSAETRRAAYVIGADGVRSVVRAAIGQPFPGRSAVQSVMLADVRLTEPPPDVLTINAVGDGFAFIAPFGDGWYRVIAWDRRNQRPDTAPVDFDEIRAATARALGHDYGMHDARWMSRFHSDERQAPRYRVGRVLLAGDAAHVHSPAGGQGMNIGIQDAANLSWKLAATIAGRGPADLLDTYQAERHPVGEQVIALSGALLRVGMLRRWELPMVKIMARTATRLSPVGRRIAGRASGIAIGYPGPRGAHPLVGQRASDVPLTSGRLYEALRAGEFVLVAPSGTVAPPETGMPPGNGGFDGVRTVTALATDTPTMLVRPDGYVAWAAERPDAATISRAVASWTGPSR
jgi:2-polyprenyl-6-methoxyphenol hydroxylase-like FAD-dependent oxidoreductase